MMPLFSASVELICVLALFPLLAASCAGFVIGFLQTLFQVQEQCCLFLIRFTSCMLILLLVAPWGMNKLHSLLRLCVVLVEHGGP